MEDFSSARQFDDEGESPLYDELREIVDGVGERPLLAFLKKNPFVLRQSMYSGWGHEDYVLHEFSFGGKYQADFVVLMSYSGGWEVNFIEIEPVDDQVYTKQLKASARLNGAFTQLNDWRDFVRLNRAQVQRDLADRCKEKDLLKFPGNASGNLLRAPETFVRFRYHIFIGRRERVKGDKRKKMNQCMIADDSLSIRTVDGFLDSVQKIKEAQQDGLVPDEFKLKF